MSSLKYNSIQRPIFKKRKPRIKPRFTQIKRIGAEIECFWSDERLEEYSFPEIVYDGSVHFNNHTSESDENDCDGSCRDNCECYYDCECEMCAICTRCEDSPDNCECDECLMCDGCENNFEMCDCERLKQVECKDKECSKNDVCDTCLQIFDENQSLSHNCASMGNHSYQCECECDCECECECNCNSNESVDGKIGEIVSPAFQDVNELKEYINKYYGSETNGSCGLHIHVSVKNEKAYKRLMTHSFNRYFLQEVEKWAHHNKIGYKKGVLNADLKHKSQFWQRLNGQNTFCTQEFIPKTQFRSIDKDSTRYRQLNFCYNLIGKNRRKNHTLECRLFPAFQDKQISLNAIQLFYDLVNSFLNREYNDKGVNKISKPKMNVSESKQLNEVIVLGSND